VSEEIAEFSEADDSSEAKARKEPTLNSDVLQNIPVSLSIEVGRLNIKIRDLMQLTQGSVLELDKAAG